MREFVAFQEVWELYIEFADTLDCQVVFNICRRDICALFRLSVTVRRAGRASAFDLLTFVVVVLAAGAFVEPAIVLLFETQAMLPTPMTARTMTSVTIA